VNESCSSSTWDTRDRAVARPSSPGAGLHIAVLHLMVCGSLDIPQDARPRATSRHVGVLARPALLLPQIIRQARVLASGETFTLTRDTGTIERNGTRVARFSDVARIQIRTIRGSDRDEEHRLSIVLKNDEKLRIHQSSNAKEITDIAEDLADVLGVEITRKA
jgi:hypothetical protein